MERNYTKTTPTTDPDAMRLNQLLDDCARMTAIGRECLEVFNQRFNGDAKKFRRWVRANLDRDELSVFRYIRLAQQATKLRHAEIIRLVDAYDLLDLSGKVSFEL